MIAFETWLPQILGYCAFLCDDLALRKAWVRNDTTNTSVTDFDELYEQIFDDLDSDHFQAELSKYMPNSGEKRVAITNFLESLRAFDRERQSNSELLNPDGAACFPAMEIGPECRLGGIKGKRLVSTV